MDGSDKQIKHDWTGEKLKKEENHNEIEAEKTSQDKESMDYAPGNTSVKRKSEQCSENQRKWSTDNVRKESEAHLIYCSNMQDTDLAASNSKKYKKQLNPANLPWSKTKSMEEHSDQIDQSDTEERIKFSEKSHSATQNIKESIITYFADVIESETDRPHLETIIDEIINEDDTKTIHENALETEQLEEGSSTLVVSEKMYPKCKQDRLLTSIISHRKRKSEDNDDEIKWKRSADIAPIEWNVKNFNSLNAQDSAVYAIRSKNHEKHSINAVVSIDNTLEELVKGQKIGINQTDKLPIQYKITETADEIAYDTHELETSNKASTSYQTQTRDKVLLLEDSNGSLISNLSVNELSFLSTFSDLKGSIINLPNEIKNKSTSINGLKDSKSKDIATENSSKFRDFPDISVSDLPTKAENKLVKFSNKMSNTDTKVSFYTSLQMGENSANTSKSEDTNISKNSEDELSEESLTRQAIISTFGMINSNYEEDSKIINLEHLKIYPDFIESQKEILASISHQRQQISSMNPESDDEAKFPEPCIKSDPKELNDEISIEMTLRIIRLFERLYKNFKILGEEDYKGDSALIELLEDLAEYYDPDCLPYIPDFVTKRKEPQTKKKITLAILTEELFEDNPCMGVPTGILLHIPDSFSSPIKNEYKISERDSLQFKEYPGLAKDLSSVKKDARYQKKFYKRKKPVMLPINCSGDKATWEKQPNIDSKENKIETIDDDLGIATRNSENGVHEKFPEDQKIILRSKDLLKENENSEDTLSTKEQTKVKKDHRYQKKIYKRKLPLLPINGSGDGNSSSEIEHHIDSNKNIIQRVGYDQRITSRNSEDSVHEESEYSEVRLKDKNMLKEKEKSPQDTLSKTSDLRNIEQIPSWKSPNSSQLYSPKN